MTTAPGIEPDMIAATGVQTTQAQRSAGRFGDIYDWGAYSSQIAGPVTVASLHASGNYQARDIVAAAANGASGGMMGMPGGYSGATPYYGGGGGMSMAMRNQTIDPGIQPPGTPTTDILGMAQQQIAQSGVQAATMLIMQDQMGRQTVQNTAISHVMNQRDSMLTSIIRNTKV